MRHPAKLSFAAKRRKKVYAGPKAHPVSYSVTFMPGYVYILASGRKGTLYIGVTSDLVKRASEHKLGIKSGFPKKYHVHQLVYYETYEDIFTAIEREKVLKKWRRAWKIALIEKDNQWWHDLCPTILGDDWTAA